ncbi:MAG: hypothetical protein Q8O10_10235 [candidate division Zixibacteria bacterium]|nr:hypothetical protein [candidate division Zixibacteria bacterium]
MSSLKQVHMSAPALIGKRLPFEQRLYLLGIDESDYRKYEEIFLRYREASHYIQKTKDSWVEIKHPWRKREVLRHLTGERTIGLFPGEKLDYMMIDIDRHDHEAKANLRSRIKKVRKAIEGKPLMYQSSSSGGIRLCYFLSNPVSRELLYQRCKDLLSEKDVNVKPGEIEILAKKSGDRLPFGSGSYIVHPLTLKPRTNLTLKQTISKAYDIFKKHKIEIPFKIQALNQTSIGGTQRPRDYKQIVSRLYDEGLYPEISTYEAFMKLSWDMRIRQGRSEEETEGTLIMWIREKHNGLSNRMNAGRIDEVLAQIKKIVTSIDEKKAKFIGTGSVFAEKKLSLGDVRKIVLLTVDSKLRQAMFSLLKHCMKKGKHIADFNGEGKTNKPSNSYMSGTDYLRSSQGSQKDLYCAIPKKTFQQLVGFDKANPQIMRRKIEALGLLSLKKKAHPDSNHCAEYWVHFQFDENDPVKVASLNEGLLLLERSEKKEGSWISQKSELCGRT